jgi:hypothetical protein
MAVSRTLMQRAPYILNARSAFLIRVKRIKKATSDTAKLQTHSIPVLMVMPG